MSVFGSTLLILSLLFVQVASAVKMDETTHDVVIHRLELGIDGMDKNEPDRNGIMVRLAELYADRARLKAINEIESNCQNCKGAQQDRQKAIALYQSALLKLDKKLQGRMVLQIAHLFALNDQPAKSTALYNQILKAKRGTYSSEVKAIALTNIGEIKFRQGNFKSALKDFLAARKENLKARALVEFRIAWCQLNLGQNDLAIRTLIHLLKDPATLATQTTDGKNIDPSFVKDLSRDLAIFYAHSRVRPQEIDTLKQLSPQDARKDNLKALAIESDRLGKKETALIVWAAYVDEGETQPLEKLDVQTRVAQIYYDMNKQTLAANAYLKALDLWSKLGCSDANICPDLKTKLKKLVTSWNKAQKNAPTENLMNVYLAYTKTFPTETEMLHWGGVVARSLKKHKIAADLFHQAAAQAIIDLRKTPDKKELKNIFEGSLLAQLEMAEASQDLKVRELAYNYYLQVNPSGSKAYEVRYQRAQVFYAGNRFQEAFSEFHYLAQPGPDHRALRVQAADLALDSLVALKDDQNLQVRSLEYARSFPERKTEYLKVSRKATMNLVAAQLKDKNAKSDYKASLAAMGQVNLEGADNNEKIKYYKNKITIAEKALDLNQTQDACRALLAIPTLTSGDREWAMAQQVWALELQLNFEEAYRLSRQMELPDLSKPDRELRLALLAELSGLSAKPHHEAYLRLKPSGRSSNLVRVSLVKNVANQWKEFDRQFKFLKTTPDLMAGLVLEIFAKHKDNSRAERLLKSTQISQFPAGKTLQRHLDLKIFLAFDKKISNHKIYAYSDSAMQKTLRERAKLLNESERSAQNFIRRQDWTLQTLSLSQVARENRRLYQDIQTLPVPPRLRGAERSKYLQLLKQQSSPYLARAEKIEAQVQSSWSHSNSVQNLQAAYINAAPEMQKLIREEISQLAKNAPSGTKNRLQDLLNTPYRRPSQKDILLARRELQASPFDVSRAEQLRELESQSGRPAMVAYLDERITQLRKGQTL